MNLQSTRVAGENKHKGGLTSFFKEVKIFQVSGRSKGKIDKQRTAHKGNWWSVYLGSVPGTVWGRVLGYPGRHDLIYESCLDWTECPRDNWTFPQDKQDMSMGWLRSRSGGVPPNFFTFIGFFFSQLNIVIQIAEVWRQNLLRKSLNGCFHIQKARQGVDRQTLDFPVRGTGGHLTRAGVHALISCHESTCIEATSRAGRAEAEK